MATVRDKFSKEYFEKRARDPSIIFRGRDLSFVKHPFYSRCIRKYMPRGKLLDIGCGEGSLLKWAGKCRYDVYGIDISEFAARLSRRALSQANLVVGDVRSLPFEDDCFDVVTCFDVLEHLLEPLIALEEINRILKGKGILVMSSPNICSKGLRWKGNDWYGYRDATHVSLLSGDQWDELLERAKFRIADRFVDTLWDSPYFRHIPRALQHLVFKSSLLLLYWTPIRFPRQWGECLYRVAIKGTHRLEALRGRRDAEM